MWVSKMGGGQHCPFCGPEMCCPSPPCVQDYLTPLLCAADSGDVEVLRLLLAAGADVAARSQVRAQEAEAALLPLARHQLSAVPQQFGDSALHLAAARGHAPAVALLLADPRVDVAAVDRVRPWDVGGAICRQQPAATTAPPPSQLPPAGWPHSFRCSPPRRRY